MPYTQRILEFIIEGKSSLEPKWDIIFLRDGYNDDSRRPGIVGSRKSMSWQNDMLLIETNFT